MEEEQSIETEIATAERSPEEKARLAELARERTARLNALGLNSRGKPKKDRHKLQKKYQDAYNVKQRAARARLGLTIAEFMKLPAATRLMELNHPAGGIDAKAKRKVQRLEWYHKNKDKVMAARRAKAEARNGVLPADDRIVKWCPGCGWNIDACRKAQAFVDGRAG